MLFKKNRTNDLKVYLIEDADKDYSVRVQVGHEILAPERTVPDADKALSYASNVLLSAVPDNELDLYNQPVYKSLSVDDIDKWDDTFQKRLEETAPAEDILTKCCDYTLISPHVDHVEKGDVIDIRKRDVIFPLLKARKRRGYIGVDMMNVPNYLSSGFHPVLDMVDDNYSIVKIRRQVKTQSVWKSLFPQKTKRQKPARELKTIEDTQQLAIVMKRQVDKTHLL